MSSLAPIIGLVWVAAITPGPNNLIVLRASAREGLRAAVPVILGAVTGGLALLAVISAGAGRVFAAEPRVRTSLAVAGGLYLAWLGVRLIARAGRAATEDDERVLPRAAAPRLATMFAFQFLNPKAWVMVLTVSAAAADRTVALPLIQTVVPLVCLSLWAALGMFGVRRLRGAATGWLDRVCGVALIVVALAVALEG